MARNFGIVYASGSKAIRRIILPDTDAELLNSTHKLAPGEALLIITDGGASDLRSCEQAVEVATGIKPADPQCAVVANGAVVGIIKADPTIDRHSDGEIVSCAKDIAVGDSYDAATKVFTKAIAAVVP